MTSDTRVPTDVLRIINETPVLVSLLYDANLLPEQVDTREKIIAMFAVVRAYQIGCSDIKEPEYTHADMMVKVKPLMFSVRSETLPDGAHLAADCPFGRYYIAYKEAHGFGWKRAGSYVFGGFESSEAAAIMFAQADYEYLMMTSLTLAPMTPQRAAIADIEADAFRRGAEQMRERAARIIDPAKNAREGLWSNDLRRNAAAIRALPPTEEE